MQPMVMKANKWIKHNLTRCSAFKRYKSSPILNYNVLDKSKNFYQHTAYGFSGSQTVGFAGVDGFNGLSPRFQD